MMTFANQRVAYGEALLTLGRGNPRVVVLDADLGGSTMGRMFEDAYPARHFEVGIAEANMTGIAAGLALAGKIPFISSFAVFAAGRAYDQIRQSICIARLPVVICGSSAGLSDFGDGATHQAIDDIAIMRTLPNMTVLCPADPREAYAATLAAADHGGPVYLRINRNDYADITPPDEPFAIGQIRTLRDGTDVAIIAAGYMTTLAMQAAAALDGHLSAKVISIATIKPIDTNALAAAIGDCRAVVCAEEHSIIGGLGAAITEAMRKCPKPTEFVGMQDTFGRSAHGYDELLAHFGLTAKGIAAAARGVCGL